MLHCADCGTSEGRIINSRKFGRALCHKCYQINEYHGDVEFHELPPKGEIHYDSKGRPICHICGMAVGKLMSHVRQKHNMLSYEYKKEFGLNTSKSIMSEACKEVARQRNLEHRDTVVYKNLLERGVGTRYKVGSGGRPRESLSLQEKKALIERLKRFRSARAVL